MQETAYSSAHKDREKPPKIHFQRFRLLSVSQIFMTSSVQNTLTSKMAEDE